MTAVFLPFEMLRALSRSARAAKTVCCWQECQEKPSNTSCLRQGCPLPGGARQAVAPGPDICRRGVLVEAARLGPMATTIRIIMNTTMITNDDHDDGHDGDPDATVLVAAAAAGPLAVAVVCSCPRSCRCSCPQPRGGSRARRPWITTVRMARVNGDAENEYEAAIRLCIFPVLP